jgi:ATP phosphoribosyltransferase
MDKKIVIALPKGRLGDQAMEYFNKKGIKVSALAENSRKLIFDSDCGKYQVILVRASDVTVYVESGAADIGVVGKDMIMEYEPDVYEPKDLGIGKCRMSIAKAKDKEIDLSFKDWGNIKIATKFTNVAKKYFKDKGINAEIIKLYGSVELAPLLGLADAIVDIVDTGNTLRENGLEEIITIFEATARIIVNKASMKLYYDRLKEIIS